jgi:pimeloyl-ACP methyl ester carboxylesterase
MNYAYYFAVVALLGCRSLSVFGQETETLHRDVRIDTEVTLHTIESGDIQGDRSGEAKLLRDKLYDDFIGPVKAAFAAGDNEEALRKFLDFVAGKGAIGQLPKEAVDVCRRNILELKALMESEQRYPPVSKERVRQLQVPVLILSGDKSADVGVFTDPELQRLLPRDSSQRVILKDVTHLMWSEKPKESREAVIQFIKDHAEN